MKLSVISGIWDLFCLYVFFIRPVLSSSQEMRKKCSAICREKNDRLDMHNSEICCFRLALSSFARMIESQRKLPLDAKTIWCIYKEAADFWRFNKSNVRNNGFWIFSLCNEIHSVINQIYNGTRLEVRFRRRLFMPTSSFSLVRHVRVLSWGLNGSRRYIVYLNCHPEIKQFNINLI